MSQMSELFGAQERESFCRRAMHTLTGSVVIVVSSAAMMFLVQWFSK